MSNPPNKATLEAILNGTPTPKTMTLDQLKAVEAPSPMYAPGDPRAHPVAGMCTTTERQETVQQALDAAQAGFATEFPETGVSPAPIYLDNVPPSHPVDITINGIKSGTDGVVFTAATVVQVGVQVCANGAFEATPPPVTVIP